MKKVAWAMSCICMGLLIGGTACLGSNLVISEVAWAGTAASFSDEWIELQNTSDVTIDLNGWLISFGNTLIPLGEVGEDTLEIRTTLLAPGAFLLLERTDDNTISDITADILYKGTLSNAGILIELRNPDGILVDSVEPLETGWPAGGAGNAQPPHSTMERTDLGEWTSNNGIIRNGLDADGNPLNGTPGQPNSAEVLAQLAPSVSLLFPNEEGVILSGIEVVSWLANDPDGEDAALSIAILISVNDGIDWMMVIENMTNTGAFSWNTTAHTVGEGYLLKVRALDTEGYVGEAVSPLFEIAASE